ncbi:MAG: hypothetical protein JNN03_18920 [Rubrivivax sp.]|nr:hypothetical protein [Rubrivivax sp.]
MPDPRDPLLKPLLEQAPELRRRNRHGPFGGVETGAFFDRAYLPAGHRFTFELALWSPTRAVAEGDEQVVVDLLWRGWRVGGWTRAGLGKVMVVEMRGRRFCLGRREKPTTGLGGAEGELKHYLALPVLGEARAADLHVLRRPGALASSSPRTHSAWTATLVIEGGLRVGGGTRSVGQSAAASEADDTPYSEPFVDWRGPTAAMDWRVVLPASSIKGPLRHRVSFHDRRLRGQVAEQLLAPGAGPLPPSRAEQAFFGLASDNDRGHAGAIWVDDIAIDRAVAMGHAATMRHLSIDRLTGGGREGLLYTLENLYRVELPLRLECDPAAAVANGADATAFGALELALDDLRRGWLGLGADWAAGLGVGVCGGAPQWRPALPARGETSNGAASAPPDVAA